MTAATPPRPAGPSSGPGGGAGGAPSRRLVRPGLGMVAALAWSAGVGAGAVLVPAAAGLAGPLYLLGCLALAVLWYGRDHERLLEVALWLWVLAPGVRRAVDLGAGYHQDSPVLLAAPLVSLVAGAGAVAALRGQGGAVRRLGLRLALVVAYGGAVAVVVGVGPPAVAVAGFQVLAPLALGMALLPRAQRYANLVVVERWGLWVLLLVGSYGVMQYLVAPRWDRQWLVDVADVAQSFGRPEPLQIRVFSTVNDPGSLASVLVLCLLLVLSRRRLGALGVVALVVGAACLGLTLVRSSWIVLAVALVFLALRGWLRTGRLVSLAVVLVVATGLFGAVAQPVLERFQSSTASGTSDKSYQDRVAFQSLNLAPALVDPIGSGLGSTGTAVRRDAAADQAFANADSGYLELLRTYGGPLGGLAVVSIVGACLGCAWRRALWFEGAAAFAVAAPVQLLFSNVLAGVSGAVFWLALALARSADPDES